MTDNDSDLRPLFARQRKLDHSLAPACRPELLVPRPKHGATSPLRWLLPLGTAAATAAMMVWMSLAPDTSLQTLPPLLAEQRPDDQLFPSLASSEWPSDFLKPSHLNLVIP